MEGIPSLCASSVNGGDPHAACEWGAPHLCVNGGPPFFCEQRDTEGTQQPPESGGATGGHLAAPGWGSQCRPGSPRMGGHGVDLAALAWGSQGRPGSPRDGGHRVDLAAPRSRGHGGTILPGAASTGSAEHHMKRLWAAPAPCDGLCPTRRSAPARHMSPGVPAAAGEPGWVPHGGVTGGGAPHAVSPLSHRIRWPRRWPGTALEWAAGAVPQLGRGAVPAVAGGDTEAAGLLARWVPGQGPRRGPWVTSLGDIPG